MTEELKGTQQNDLATDLKQQDVHFHTTHAEIVNSLASDISDVKNVNEFKKWLDTFQGRNISSRAVTYYDPDAASSWENS